MKRCWWLVFLLLAAVFPASSHDRDSLGRYGGSYHCYEFSVIEDTPPPEGFSPFYISHYGRHGSRYLTRSKLLKGMRLMRRSGPVTEQGQELKECFSEVVKANAGSQGKLSALGAAEHENLSLRMQERFPGLFNNEERPVLRARATSIRRTQKSMESFLSRIDGMEKDVRKGYRYLKSFSRHHSLSGREKNMLDSMLRAEFSPERFIGTCFRRTSGDPYALCRYLFIFAADCQDTGLEPRLYEFFTEEEIRSLYADMNRDVLVRYMNSEEFGAEIIASARPLLASIISDADAVLKDGSPVAADLRFGHDSGLGPLVSIMGLMEPVSVLGAEAFQSWSSLSMASNIQMVFYHNDEGDILVKILYNEREVPVPGLSGGPYYPWDEFRSHMMSKLAP